MSRVKKNTKKTVGTKEPLTSTRVFKEVYIVNDLCGEGKMHAFCYKDDAFKFGEDGFVYSRIADLTKTKQAKPFKISGGKVVEEGANVWITYECCGGCFHNVSGVYSTKAAAEASPVACWGVMSLIVEGHSE